LFTETLIPHQPPMRWIDELTKCGDTTAIATACFTDGHFAVTGGAVLETALVECVAQTVAAALGFRSRRSDFHPVSESQGGSGEGDRPEAISHGMLAAVSNFRIHTPPPLDKRLEIEVRELRRFGPMLLVHGSITCEGKVVATGELSLYA
jgi:hypothetical protein